MSNAQVYYVNRDGSYGAATVQPPDSLAISFEQYSLISENPDLIDVSVEGSVVRIIPSLPSYKNTAVASIKAEIAKHMPDDVRINKLFRAVALDRGCFDEVSGLQLDYEEAKGNLVALHERQDAMSYLQHKYTNKVMQALNVVEVDQHLTSFERTLQGSV